MEDTKERDSTKKDLVRVKAMKQGPAQLMSPMPSLPPPLAHGAQEGQEQHKKR